MKTYRHHVLGLYDTWDAAEATRDALRRCGLPAAQLRLLQPDRRLLVPGQRSAASSDSALLVNGVGMADDVSIEQALSDVSLFAASPVLGALMAQGWRASLGRVAGVVLQAVTREAPEADDVPPRDEHPAGATVLLVRADDERQRVLARLMVAASMGGASQSTLHDDRVEHGVGTPLPQELAQAESVLPSLLNRRRGAERRGASSSAPGSA